MLTTNDSLRRPETSRTCSRLVRRSWAGGRPGGLRRCRAAGRTGRARRTRRQGRSTQGRSTEGRRAPRTGAARRKGRARRTQRRGRRSCQQGLRTPRRELRTRHHRPPRLRRMLQAAGWRGWQLK